MSVEADLTHKQSIAIGPELERMLDLARASDLPTLLVGKHGIGKSEFLTSYAKSRGIAPYVLDLSLLEATDLTGIPFVADGVTRFAPPSTLPSERDDRPSLLVLEELNRCDRSVRQPCLQLLTARHLNDYWLPKTCMLVACINPPDVGYDVDELDAALASRFVTMRVSSDRRAWAKWARQATVLEEVVRFIEKYQQAFETAPPRTWTFAARLLASAKEQKWSHDDMELILQTLLPPVAARALALELKDPVPSLPEAIDIALDPRAHIGTMRALTEHKRLDIIREVMASLAALLTNPKEQNLLKSAETREGLRALIAAAPPDLRKPVEKILAKNGA
jgi:MoxR-like ATPase